MSKHGLDDAFIHVFNGHAKVYGGLLGQRANREQIEDLLFNPGLRRAQILYDLEERLSLMDWWVGVDGWRAPLDPGVGIWATAHLSRGRIAYLRAWPRSTRGRDEITADR